MKKLMLSGVQPSGTLHIGNYLGAIRQWVAMQADHDVFVMIADLHAITVPQKPAELCAKTMEVAALLLAAGIDPERSTLFVQSHVPAHTELAWILNTLTPLGELERMTQFKDKKDKAGELAGLFNYPVLMASDVLLYQTAVVPVGEDQLQHLELTRTLAHKFNTRFGETFKIPEALITKDTGRIMGLDDPGRKMSKSAASPTNYIALLDTPDDIRLKIKAAVTDSGREIVYDEEKKPAIANLLRIFSACSERTISELQDQYRGASYAGFKNDLAEAVVGKLAPIQQRYATLMADEKALMEILRAAAGRAGDVAEKTLRDAKHKVGFLLS